MLPESFKKPCIQAYYKITQEVHSKPEVLIPLLIQQPLLSGMKNTPKADS